MRRLALGSVLAVTAFVLASGAAAADGRSRIRLTEAGGANFPSRSYVLSVPTGTTIRPGTVAVAENGGGVANLTVTSAGATAPGKFATVLVVDASDSMAGKPIKDALAAARAFAAHRNPTAQLALVTFNRTPRVAMPFTRNAARIQSALASTPPLGNGTHIYGAVSLAIGLLKQARIASGSVVILSDGADTGSRVAEADVSSAARAAHVRIFSVGLRSRVFDRQALAKLAFDAGGSYSEAHSSKDLATIYDQLGARLANQYLVQYRSLAGPNKVVRVVVSVEGVPGSATTGYTTPALPKVHVPPFHPSLGYRFWQSPVSMVLIALLAAALVAGGILLALRPGNRTLRKRMAAFVSLYAAAPGEESHSLADVVFGGAERSLQRAKWWPRFKEELEIAEIRIPAIQIVLGTLGATIFTMWLIAVIGGSAVYAVLGLFVPVAVRSVIKRKLERKRAQFADQLPDSLQVLSSALRAGHSFVSALSVVVDDAPEPTKSELKRVVADEQLGVPLEDALEVVVRRMDNSDLEQVALVAALQRETGGSSAEVLDRVTEVVRGRIELRLLVKSLTAQGRLSRWVVTFLPVALMGAIMLLNPGYLDPLFNTAFGRVLLVLAAVMVVSGSLAIKKIVEIKV